MSVFISYSRADAAQARMLADDLEALGHTVWYDPELVGGDNWWQQILAQVRGCNVFILAVSDTSLQSEACRREYTYALAVRRHVVPVIIDANVLPDVLPPSLRDLQLVIYHAQSAKLGVLALARALSKLAPPQHTATDLPDPLPDAPESPLSNLALLRDRIASPQPLSAAAQQAVLAELRVFLDSGVDPSGARNLIAVLRRRKDLLEVVADQLDGLKPVRGSRFWQLRTAAEVIGLATIGWGLGRFGGQVANSPPVALVVTLTVWGFALYRAVRAFRAGGERS